ncbi:MAG TPA: LuxR C-terminal-related transcriptional regulator, partial [Candidatus Acidoferrum sp.]|nr:LuxR C-terminal-related transcriptional regulator [Candidatus Acidoferrum sp.]
RKVVQSFKRVTPALKPAAENLSPREVDVLDYLVKGFSYKETAEAMGISYSTVHSHIEHIYHKLHVQSRAQAVARYLRV